MPSVGARRLATLPCGSVTVLQADRSVKVTTDSLLLAAVLSQDFAGHAVDLGAGTGVVAFRVAARCMAARLTAVERAPEHVEAARDALALPENGAFSARVDVRAGDVANPAPWAPQAPVDAVLFNPPFFVEGQGRPSPYSGRESARRLPSDGLVPWFATAHRLLAQGGLCAAIMPPARLGVAIAADGFGAVELTAIHPRLGTPASRVLITQRKGRKSGLAMTAPLILADADGQAPAPVAALLANHISISEALRRSS